MNMRVDWLEYYARERHLRRQRILTEAKAHWETIGTRPADMIDTIDRGGILSFPHTFLDASIGSLLNVIGAIYRSGKTNVLALGVLHGSTESTEFSLAGFVEVAELYECINQLAPLSITKVYHPPFDRVRAQSIEFVDSLREMASRLRDEIGHDTAVVMTGDLAHYGCGYGTQEPQTDGLCDSLRTQVAGSLDAVFRKRDYRSFIERSYAIKNDQIGAALLASMLLPRPLSYSIFSFELSDYSQIVRAQRPTVVASVCYGVFPTNSKTQS
jgi:hypothetical protein